MQGEMSDITYSFLMPGPWPGPPQPFRKLQAFLDVEDPVPYGHHSCGACPLSMHCLAGRQLYPLFKNDSRRMMICRKCTAVLWWMENTMYLCYRLGSGIFARIPYGIAERWADFSPSKMRLVYALAAVTGEHDVDQVLRHFRYRSTCYGYDQYDACGPLYHAWLHEHEHNPIHDQATPFIQGSPFDV